MKEIQRGDSEHDDNSDTKALRKILADEEFPTFADRTLVQRLRIPNGLGQLDGMDFVAARALDGPAALLQRFVLDNRNTIVGAVESDLHGKTSAQTGLYPLHGPAAFSNDLLTGQLANVSKNRTEIEQARCRLGGTKTYATQDH